MRNKENEQVNLLKHGFQLSLTLNVVKWALRYIVNFQAVTWRKIFVSTSHWLAEIWQLSRRGAIGKLKAKFIFQRRSYKLYFLFPPRRQSARENLLAR